MGHVQDKSPSSLPIAAETELLANIATYARDSKNEKLLIQVLHMTQHLYGHLPPAVQKVVADQMTPSRTPGVVNFYSFAVRR